MKKLGRYVLNWLIWLDEGVNVLRGGDAHETLSSVMGKVVKAGPAVRGYRLSCVICKLLDRVQKNHCANSILRDIGAEAVEPDALATLPGDNGA